MALKSQSALNGSVLTFTCTDDETKDSFERSVDLAVAFNLPGLSGHALHAVAFAAKTALRNATGGRDLADAETSVDARLAAWANEEWGAERGGSEGAGAAFTAGHILAKAVARSYADRFASAALAAEKLSAMLDASLASNGHPAFADLDENQQREARNAFVKHIRANDGGIDTAVTVITAEQAAARAQKKSAAQSTSRISFD